MCLLPTWKRLFCICLKWKRVTVRCSIWFQYLVIIYHFIKYSHFTGITTCFVLFKKSIRYCRWRLANCAIKTILVTWDDCVLNVTLEILLKCFRVIHTLTFSWKSHVFASGDLACGRRDVNFAKAASDSWRPDLQRDSWAQDRQIVWPALLSVRARHTGPGLRWPFWRLHYLLNTCAFGPELCSRCLLRSDVQPRSNPAATQTHWDLTPGRLLPRILSFHQNSKWYCFMWSMA